MHEQINYQNSYRNRNRNRQKKASLPSEFLEFHNVNTHSPTCASFQWRTSSIHGVSTNSTFVMLHGFPDLGGFLGTRGFGGFGFFVVCSGASDGATGASVSAGASPVDTLEFTGCRSDAFITTIEAKSRVDGSSGGEATLFKSRNCAIHKMYRKNRK